MSTNKETLVPAILWDHLNENVVQCKLCSFRCKINPNGYGICRVRKNIDGQLYTLNYNRVCAAAVDPIEKKPLFHFLPGSTSFSISSLGCNFKCNFCQNWQISQIEDLITNYPGSPYSPENIVHAALANDCKSISYTYTEPTVFMELANDTARIAKANGLKNVFVSNGYMTTEALEVMSEWLDAINIDLKSMTEEFYHKICKASLAPVLDTIKYIAEQTDIWMELTTLVIPGHNDSADELKNIASFIATHLGPDIPWHLSAFYPCYKMMSTPRTPVETLNQAYEIGKEAGINYIYIGNVYSVHGQHTICPKCKELLIEREGYLIEKDVVKDNRCPSCSNAIPGVF